MVGYRQPKIQFSERMGIIPSHDGARHRSDWKVMELYATLVLAGGFLIGMGACMFVVAAILAMVMIDE